MPPPPPPHVLVFPPTPLATPKPQKRQREPTPEAAEGEQAQSETAPQRKAIRAAGFAIDIDGDDSVLSSMSLRRKRPRTLDRENLKRFKELNNFSTPFMQYYMADAYTDAAEAGGDTDGPYEGGSEGTRTGGSSPV